MDFVIKKYRYEGIELSYGVSKAKKTDQHFYSVEIEVLGKKQHKLYPTRKLAKKKFNYNCKVLVDHIREERSKKGGSNA